MRSRIYPAVFVCTLLLLAACAPQEEESAVIQASTGETAPQAERIVIGDPSSGKPFSQAIQIGDTLYISGNLPIDPETNEHIKDSVEAETDQIMKNIKRMVEMAGFEMADVVKATVYLVDLNDYAAVNSVYVNYFPEDPPARACIGVKDILFGFRLEIDAIAQR